MEIDPQNLSNGRRQTRDHIIPLSRGGANRSINIVLACGRCNGLKSSDLPEQFAERLQSLISNGKNKGPFTIEILRLIYCNLQRLIVEHIKVHGDGLFKIRIPKAKKAKVVRYSDFADVGLSVNTNTFQMQKDQILFLQSQTIEQFREIYKK